MCQFDKFSFELESAISVTLESIILDLVTYFSPVNALSKKNRVIHRGTRNPQRLKVRRYATCLVDLNA